MGYCVNKLTYIYILLENYIKVGDLTGFLTVWLAGNASTGDQGNKNFSDRDFCRID